MENIITELLTVVKEKTHLLTIEEEWERLFQEWQVNIISKVLERLDKELVNEWTNQGCKLIKKNSECYALVLEPSYSNVTVSENKEKKASYRWIVVWA